MSTGITQHFSSNEAAIYQQLIKPENPRSGHRKPEESSFENHIGLIQVLNHPRICAQLRHHEHQPAWGLMNPIIDFWIGRYS
ncbi:hypothetical protein O181_070522 [Austropuccinia psidii MF-1]|uniref:Uncharacterized protein n=1 Tax=Austropuccinia psidii MF-1 TaxID=1389203 RepID=A0A9Q3F629_9BASI|nr:hypothetical protein [Austropuccinia psidii MF-1]